MKGLFIPEITAEMFRNGCLESIETLMAEGEIYDIDYSLEQEPCEDAISREQAIRATYGFERYTGIDEAPYEYAESILRDLPSVTPTQEPILDKIRAEIEQLTSRYTISRERGGMGQVEWSDRLIKESEVIKIIDKYKESEIKE